MKHLRESNRWRGSNRGSRLPGNWASLRKSALSRDNHRCQIRGPRCEGRATEVDHIKAGDDHRLVNLQSVCTTCHKSKSSQEGHQARAALRAARFRKKPAHPGRLR
ncbi:HNH endonuclease [Saccharopolyspora indica]|uniref:HNH endonuclease n=1 Tax=Saccharopolyspora indica TaxID=1229659 RepID=UPI00356AB2A2